MGLFTIFLPQLPEMERDDDKIEVSSCNLPVFTGRRRFLVRGCDEACFSETRGFSVKRGEPFSESGVLVRISTGKAVR